MAVPRFRVLVIMPFARAYDGLFELIREAAAAADADARRVDKEHFEGEIMTKLVSDLESADAVIAVLTGQNPNVYYEVGFAAALGKHLLPLTADRKLPFDVAGRKAIPYRTRSQKLPSAVVHADSLRQEITEQLQYLLTRPPDASQEYRKAAGHVKSVAGGLADFLTPFAPAFFNQWFGFVRNLVGGGIPTDGPTRRDVTSLLVHATGQYRVLERMVGKPESLQSKGWVAFYDGIARDDRIRKVWILCVDEDELVAKKEDVIASCKFRQSKGFETRYYSPRELQRGGQPLPPFEAIEDYGEFAKFLHLPDKTYASGKTLDVLETIFRPTDYTHRQLMEELINHSEIMDDAWLQRLDSSMDASASSGLPVSAGH